MPEKRNRPSKNVGYVEEGPLTVCYFWFVCFAWEALDEDIQEYLRIVVKQGGVKKFKTSTYSPKNSSRFIELLTKILDDVTEPA